MGTPQSTGGELDTNCKIGVAAIVSECCHEKYLQKIFKIVWIEYLYTLDGLMVKIVDMSADKMNWTFYWTLSWDNSVDRPINNKLFLLDIGHWTKEAFGTRIMLVDFFISLTVDFNLWTKEACDKWTIKVPSINKYSASMGNPLWTGGELNNVALHAIVPCTPALDHDTNTK